MDRAPLTVRSRIDARGRAHGATLLAHLRTDARAVAICTTESSRARGVPRPDLDPWIAGRASQRELR